MIGVAYSVAMPTWLLRGVGMAVLHAVAAVVLAKIASRTPTDLSVPTTVVIALLVGAAALWSAIDAWLDVDDRGRGWFIGALVAGVLGGILSVIGRSIFVDQTGIRDLGAALTGGAAFTALLVLLPAGLGLLVGGKLRKDDEFDDRAGGDDSGRGAHRADEKPVDEKPVDADEDGAPKHGAAEHGAPDRSAPDLSGPAPSPRRRRPTADGEPAPRPSRSARRSARN